MGKIGSGLSYLKNENNPKYANLPATEVIYPTNKAKLVHPITTCDRGILRTISFVRKPFVQPLILAILGFGILTLIICSVNSSLNFNCEYEYGYTIFNLPFVKSNNKDGKIKSPSPPTPEMCSNVSNIERFDCFPQGQATEETCNSRGCCWDLPQEKHNQSVTDLNIPYCFYSKPFANYQYVNVSVNDLGATAFMKINFSSPYSKDIQYVKLDFMYETENRLHIKIYDATEKRFETPFPDIPNVEKAAKNTKYFVDIDKEKLGFAVVRKSNNKTIFDTQGIGGFIFSDQFLQISAKVPSTNLYGLGQQYNDFLLDMNWNLISLFNHDQVPSAKTNLYGAHPFFLVMEENGLSNGVFLHNSNAMDIILQPTPAVTYRTIGGIFDFYVFLGPSPADVVKQYVHLMQRPLLPPYWSLGFHLCRYGYKSLARTIEVWNRTRAAGIPLDTQWNDLDYMDSNNDFTYNNNTFNGLPEFVKHLHESGMHYIPIIDPGISASELPGTYPPYDEGIREGIFIMDSNGVRPFVGKVWNKVSTVFPDFSHPSVVQYWLNQMRRMHDLFPYDGAWIDMNDPSNFLDGEVTGCPPNNTYETPPYVPAVSGGKLNFRTVCMSAKQKLGIHYNLHNVYGTMEAVATSYALSTIRNKRPFVISRSSFSGHGHYAGIWTGDIESTWEYMRHSVSDIMSFSLFGIPLAGADICGFVGNTTPALCQRWSQLGAFYPFSRNHNSDDTIDQDPVALGPDVVDSARKALLIRYSMLPYLYTLFFAASTRGDTVVRPLFFEFPADEKTFSVSSQFLWGPGLLICPVLKQDQTYVSVYLPSGRWYDYYTSRPINSNGTNYTIPAPLDTIPLLLVGGHIIPTQEPNVTTTLSRQNKMGLLVSLDSKGKAKGELYWDDGDSIGVLEKKLYNLFSFSASDNKLSSSVDTWGYNTAMTLGSVQVLGVDKTVKSVTVDGKAVPFTYNAPMKHLTINNISIDMSKPFAVIWA